MRPRAGARTLPPHGNEANGECREQLSGQGAPTLLALRRLKSDRWLAGTYLAQHARHIGPFFDHGFLAHDSSALQTGSFVYGEVRRPSLMQVQVPMLSNACIGGCVLRTSILSRQIFVR